MEDESARCAEANGSHGTSTLEFAGDWSAVPMPDVQRLKSDLLALAILALTVFLGLALVSYSPSDPPGDVVYPAPTQLHNLCGPAGARLAHQLHSALGLGSWFLLIALVLFD